MAYYRHFILKWKAVEGYAGLVNSKIEHVVLKEAKKFNGGGSEIERLVRHERDYLAWPAWLPQMIVFSDMVRGVLFELEGIGEDVNDFWKAYFQNGQHHICKGQIVYEDFDPEKLI